VDDQNVVAMIFHQVGGNALGAAESLENAAILDDFAIFICKL
jgi:hypothetical protein